jgi:hypothetical protein
VSKISTKYPNRSFDYIDKFKVEIESLYKQGNSIRAIAQQLSLSKSTVGDYIRKLGISRNDFNGDKNPFYGKKHSAEFCEKISKFNKGRKPPCTGTHKYPSSKYFLGSLIQRWKESASKRKIEWDITKDQLDNLWEKQNGLCALTGQTMHLERSSDHKWSIVSLDRIDSAGIYDVDNCQLVISAVNLSKYTFSNKQYIDLCRKVMEYQNVNG